MLKDTIHSKVLDTEYRTGVTLLKEGEYSQALNILKEYRDFNTALAYLSLDYNYSALEIIEEMNSSAKKYYVLAIINSRLGKYKEAIELYIKACELEPSMKFRGQLDPEIKQLIDKYKIN